MEALMNCSCHHHLLLSLFFLSAKVVVTLPITFADSNTDCYNRLTLDLKVIRIAPQMSGCCMRIVCGWGRDGLHY